MTLSNDPLLLLVSRCLLCNSSGPSMETPIKKIMLVKQFAKFFGDQRTVRLENILDALTPAILFLEFKGLFEVIDT